MLPSHNSVVSGSHRGVGGGNVDEPEAEEEVAGGVRTERAVGVVVGLESRPPKRCEGCQRGNISWKKVCSQD